MREVDPRAVPGGAERIRMSRPNSHWVISGCSQSCLEFVVRSSAHRRVVNAADPGTSRAGRRNRAVLIGNARQEGGPKTTHSNGQDLTDVTESLAIATVSRGFRAEQ